MENKKQSIASSDSQTIISQDVQSIIGTIQAEARVLEGKTVLISGGAGFLGNYFVGTLLGLNKKILKTPCTVIVMDNFITGSKETVDTNTYSKNFRFIEHDVRNPIPLSINADYVIHAAGLASPFYYRKFPLETIEVAVNGTKNFLEYCRVKKVKNFLYFSSSEIYGDPHPNFIPTPEHYFGNVSSVGPRACYDESKRLGETLCSTYHQLYGVPVKIVRPFNVYGPGMKINDYRVIPTFMMKVLKKEPLPVHDHGNQTRTFCYITDAVQGFLKVLLSGENGHTYNVGRDAEEINIMGLATIIANLSSHPADIRLIPYPESYPGGEPQRRCPDITKIKSTLGFSPTINLQTGLQRTLQWYKAIIAKELKTREV